MHASIFKFYSHVLHFLSYFFGMCYISISCISLFYWRVTNYKLLSSNGLLWLLLLPRIFLLKFAIVFTVACRCRRLIELARRVAMRHSQSHNYYSAVSRRPASGLTSTCCCPMFVLRERRCLYMCLRTKNVLLPKCQRQRL